MLRKELKEALRKLKDGKAIEWDIPVHSTIFQEKLGNMGERR